jgi:hypothetical protein
MDSVIKLSGLPLWTTRSSESARESFCLRGIPAGGGVVFVADRRQVLPPHILGEPAPSFARCFVKSEVVRRIHPPSTSGAIPTAQSTLPAQ